MSVSEIKNYMAVKTPKTIVFSCFETVLSRKLSPENIKMLWAKEVLNYLEIPECVDEMFKIRIKTESKFLKNQNDESYDIQLIFNAIAEETHDWYFQLYSRSEFVQLMMNIEISTEYRLTCGNDIYKNLCTYAKQQGKKVIIVADYHLNKSILSEILAFHKIADFDELYVSCDCVQDKNNITKYSSLKHELVFLGEKSHFKAYLSNEENVIATDNGNSCKTLYDVKAENQDVKSILKNNSELILAINDNKYENIAFAFYYFIDKLYALLLRNGVDHVYFLTREGKFFQALFELYREQQGYQYDQYINSTLLWVSRRSTCIASLKELQYETFEFVFKRYRLNSLYDFLILLNFSKDEIVYIKDISSGFNINSDLCNIQDSQEFKQLMQCRYFIRLYEEKRVEQKKLIKDYFSKMGINNSLMHIVDIGWYGTIQDQIYRLFEGRCNIHGYYLGYCVNEQNLLMQTYNNVKTGVLFTQHVDKKKVADLTSMVYYTHSTLSIYLYEMLSACEEGSVLYYTPAGYILDDDRQEKDTYKLIIKPIQKKIVNIFKQLLCEFSYTSITYKHYEKAFRNIHMRLIKPIQDIKPKYDEDGLVAMQTFVIDEKTKEITIR